MALMLAEVGFAQPVPQPSADEDVQLQRHLRESRAQIDRLREQAGELLDQVARTHALLKTAQERNRSQAARIGQLEQRLTDLPAAAPDEPLRAGFFNHLQLVLPPSGLYRVMPDRVVIFADPVYVFGKGIIGAEGIERLDPVLAILRDALAMLPPGISWRLRVEGHTDPRPLRANPRFPSNWELSAARAVAMLRLMEARGIPAYRLVAAAYAAQRPLTSGRDSRSHRLNRRIEIHLDLDRAGEGEVRVDAGEPASLTGRTQ
jgi:chemotaxis protein MotB